MKRLHLFALLTALISLGTLGCQSNPEEVEILSLGSGGGQGLTAGGLSTEGISVVDGMLSFDTEEIYASTITALVEAENEQASGDTEEAFPLLADFENQFAGFLSQRKSIQAAYFAGDYDLESLPDASAVKSPALQATLNADGQVRVQGQLFTFTDEGITSEEGSRPMENSRNGEDCCITWKSDQRVSAHNTNQFLIGRGYIYNFTLFGFQYIFMKGTQAINLRLSLTFTPWNMESIRAQPWSGWYARGGCSGPRTHFTPGVQENHNSYQATESFTAGTLFAANQLYGVDTQMHLVMGTQKYDLSFWIFNCK
ncbi:MAG: hypothetical protein AAFQ98_20430 [Bacteroidota bacterium]